MTNGEKILNTFSNAPTRICRNKDFTYIEVEQNDKWIADFDIEWWNAEYKEPTTKNDLAHNLCDSCTNIGCVFQSGIVRSECASYMPPQLEPDNCGNYVVQDTTTKNDLADDKTFYEQMVEYCNEHFLVLVEKDVWEDAEKALTAKNDLGVDAVSRAEVHNMLENLPITVEDKWFNWLQKACIRLAEMPSVTPQPDKNDAVDCISRKAVFEVIDDCNSDGLKGIFCSYDDGERFKEYIKNLSPLTPQEPRWIPVSEKLPNDRNWYLGIFKEPDTGWINPLPFICDYVGRETKATTKEYWILRGFTDMDERIDYYFNLECVAWMPLPSSYER